ncbi:MAG: 3-deoxy-8-phosphooctulonate synthase [Candidatus Helarchaeota archaeon]
MTKEININNVKIGNNNPFVLIAGPCIIESEENSLETAFKIKEITKDLKIPFIFKSSYLKDNRSLPSSYKGPGLIAGLEILAKVKKEVGVPVLSDVHCRTEVEKATKVLDVIQIPAFLCRQTQLALTVGRTNKPINLKKGQFLAPWDMEQVITKIKFTGNDKIILTERGTCFGYNNLIWDLKSIPIMQSFGYPVAVDITHIIRRPGISSEDFSGGSPQFISKYAYAAIAVGCDALFIETHVDPKNALCDANSQLKLSKLKKILQEAKKINELVKNF